MLQYYALGDSVSTVQIELRCIATTLQCVVGVCHKTITEQLIMESTVCVYCHEWYAEDSTDQAPMHCNHTVCDTLTYNRPFPAAKHSVYLSCYYGQLKQQQTRVKWRRQLTYIQKANKLADAAFWPKKLAEKVRRSQHKFHNKSA